MGTKGKSTVVTLRITTDQRDALRKLAKLHGYEIGRGREKEWGSITKFTAAIAEGVLVVTPAGDCNGNGSHE